MKENVDYQLILPKDVENDQAWDIRILTGDFAETVIRFGNISIDGKNDCLKFNFMIIDSPDDELAVSNENLQEISGIILGDIIDNQIESGYILMDEK